MSFFTASILAIFAVGGLFAYRKGGPPERYAAAIIVGWIFVDAAYHLLFGSSGFDVVDPAHLLIDGGQLVAITWVALRANRMWPLWAAAASLICFAGHLAAIIEPGGLRRAYWALSSIPQFIQLLALLLGAAAHMRRLQRLGGPYRSWRKG
jgi:hypothetical protein